MIFNDILNNCPKCQLKVDEQFEKIGVTPVPIVKPLSLYLEDEDAILDRIIYDFLTKNGVINSKINVASVKAKKNLLIIFLSILTLICSLLYVFNFPIYLLEFFVLFFLHLCLNILDLIFLKLC